MAIGACDYSDKLLVQKYADKKEQYIIIILKVIHLIIMIVIQYILKNY